MNDWASETAALIDKTVGNLRDRTVEPARTATRYLTYGLLALCFALPLLTLLTIVSFRALVLLFNLLPAPHDNAWMAWATLAGIFAIAGVFLWRKSNPAASD